MQAVARAPSPKRGDMKQHPAALAPGPSGPFQSGRADRPTTAKWWARAKRGWRPATAGPELKNGGGGGNWTPVRRPSGDGHYTLSLRIL